MPMRKAYHAGSWYSSESEALLVVTNLDILLFFVPVESRLNGELDGWLRQATRSHAPARAIIAPYPSCVL